MKIQLSILISIFSFSLNGCASQQIGNDGRLTASSNPMTQFFLGKIQRSSMSGQLYGPAFESLVRRTNTGAGIKECVFQEGKAFVTEMISTANPLVYTVSDSGGFSAGSLRYENEHLEAWSYDVDVLKPMKGKITGDLAEGRGGRIYPDGKMRIVKAWNNQVLISESYESISESEYLSRLPSATPSDMVDLINQNCR